MQHVVIGILSDSTVVATDEPDRAVPTIDAAAHAVAFAPRLLHARSDPASLSILGAHSVSARVNIGQLHTLLAEAGRSSDSTPAAIDDAPVSFTIPQPEVRVPSALDTTAVLEIALELTGMSPNQARDFRQLFTWRESLALAPPRFMRSYEMVPVGDTHGMLMITAGRRGPAYELAWIDAGVVFALTGYGSSADAAPLARSAAP